jgi:hypothetical protein
VSSSFKKLVISTPLLLQGLHSMSLAKLVLDGLNPKNARDHAYVSHRLLPTCPRKMKSKKKSPR